MNITIKGKTMYAVVGNDEIKIAETGSFKLDTLDPTYVEIPVITTTEEMVANLRNAQEYATKLSELRIAMGLDKPKAKAKRTRKAKAVKKAESEGAAVQEELCQAEPQPEAAASTHVFGAGAPSLEESPSFSAE